METSTSDAIFELSKRVHHMIQQYVYERTKAKTGLSYADFPLVADQNAKWPRRDVSEEYRKAFGRVCEDAFLATRNCRCREDFVAYFTGTVCAVPQILPREDYQRLAVVLLRGDEWERVKALAMLALSALSGRHSAPASQAL